MRKTVAAAIAALGLGMALPVLAAEDSSMEELYLHSCETMAWQFDAARPARQNDARFQRAQSIYNQGMATCDYGDHLRGSAMLRVALQMIDVSPLH